MSKAATHAKLAFFDALIRDRKLSGVDIRVAWRVLDRTNDNLTSRSGERRIAKEIGANLSTVSRSVNRLEKNGWIKVVKGTGKTNKYTLAVEKCLQPRKHRVFAGRSTSVCSHANGVFAAPQTEPLTTSYVNLEKTLSQRFEEKRSARKKGSGESATNDANHHAVPSLVSNVGVAPPCQAGAWKGLASVLPRITPINDTGAPPPAVAISAMPAALATARALQDIAAMRTALTTAALAMRRQGAGLAA